MKRIIAMLGIVTTILVAGAVSADAQRVRAHVYVPLPPPPPAVVIAPPVVYVQPAHYPRYYHRHHQGTYRGYYNAPRHRYYAPAHRYHAPAHRYNHHDAPHSNRGGHRGHRR